MKNLRQLCVATVLTFIVAAYTFAGQIQTTITDPPPPPSATTEGQIQTTRASQIQTGSDEVADPVTQVALSLLQSVLSLF